MIRAMFLLILLLVSLPAGAQDVRGIESCMAESRMERRTGCLQSNVEYLHQLVRKNAADAQQKQTAANGEIAALRTAVADLQAALTKLQAAQPKQPDKK